MQGIKYYKTCYQFSYLTRLISVLHFGVISAFAAWNFFSIQSLR